MAPDLATAPSEVERKFLVHELPEDLDRFPSAKIRQGYLAIGDTEVRVRAEGKKYFLTVKTGHGESRQEVERRISKKDFAALWPLTRGRRVWKRRYRIPYGKRTIELDVYRRQLKGLITAEVEFPNREAADKFQPPAWLGPEVTGDQRFSNQNLAHSGREITESAEGA
jgi:CYTH domain-containing protein